MVAQLIVFLITGFTIFVSEWVSVSACLFLKLCNQWKLMTHCYKVCSV